MQMYFVALSFLVILCFPQMILQVEEDNPKALQFYERRGYEVIFSDPASRRFDASGIFVKTVRTTKICMRKNLSFQKLLRNADQAPNTGFNIFRALRDAVSDFGSEIISR